MEIVLRSSLLHGNRTNTSRKEIEKQVLPHNVILLFSFHFPSVELLLRRAVDGNRRARYLTPVSRENKFKEGYEYRMR
jgi:hypothetical protein